jgi:hypothetical protein
MSCLAPLTEAIASEAYENDEALEHVTLITVSQDQTPVQEESHAIVG